MWITAAPFIVGNGTPDAWCATNAPSGVVGAKALVARTGSTAASLLTPTAVYVRPDGQRIGTGADLVAATGDHYYDGLESGIWQDNLGNYKQSASPYLNAWTGATSPDSLGTAATTCRNWTDPTQVGAIFGAPGIAHGDFFAFSSKMLDPQHPCNETSFVLYCVEP
jgi:hypothetical protein